MDIGILIIATARAGSIDTIARTVEERGYESIWIPEHPVIPIGFKTPVPVAGGGGLPEHYGRWCDPFVALSIASAVTKRIKLATGICLLPEREPLITAKTIASLDLYSGGRVVLGVGAGWLREETEAMGAHFGSRWKRLRETVEAMRVAWSQPEPAYAGDIVHFPPLRCEPKPLQKPYPPILLGGHTPKVLERVARTYDGWMPLVPNPESLKRDVADLTQTHDGAWKRSRFIAYYGFRRSWRAWTVPGRSESNTQRPAPAAWSCSRRRWPSRWPMAQHLT